MQIPTVQQPSYTTHPIEVYDKRGKFLRKEFIGNDKGVADHKYIGRHHYAPRGGNSYIDTSYKIGGSFQDYLRQQNKPITENPSTLYQQPTIDEVKKQQALAKQAALYDKTFSKASTETPVSKARSLQLKNNYVANNPYSKLNDKGEIEAVSPERDLQGNPYNYTQAWRNDDGFKNITNGLEAAMLVEGAAHLGVKGLNYAGKRLFGKSSPVQPTSSQKGAIDFIGKEKTALPTNGNYGYPTQVSGAGMDTYPNTANKFLNQEYSSFGNMEKGVKSELSKSQVIESTKNLWNDIKRNVDDKVIYPIQYAKSIKNYKNYAKQQISDLNNMHTLDKLDDMGIDKTKFLEELKKVNFQSKNYPSSYSYNEYAKNADHTVNVNFRQLEKLKKDGYPLNMEQVTDHELGHFMQQSSLLKPNKYLPDNIQQYNRTMPTRIDILTDKIATEDYKLLNGKNGTDKQYFLKADKPDLLKSKTGEVEDWQKTERLPFL